MYSVFLKLTHSFHLEKERIIVLGDKIHIRALCKIIGLLTGLLVNHHNWSMNMNSCLLISSLRI